MLHVVMNGLVIGDLDGAGPRLRLRYDRAATMGTGFVPLSVSLPATQYRWRGERVVTWLSALLPDREGVLARWRALFGIRSLAVEAMLAHVGEDVAGAAQFVRPDRLDTVLSRAGTLTPLTDDDIADLVRAARRDALPYDPDTEIGHFSLAGAQSKFALQKTATGWALPSGAEPSTHIVKPAIPGLADQDVLEVVTMRLARMLGLPAARTALAAFGDERVIVIERYDRVRIDGVWYRVHQEDLCQALGVQPLMKYESQGGPGVARCAAVIREHCPAADVETFARAVMLSYLTRGTDAHGRNYSLLITPGDIRLAPLYDLTTTFTFGERWANRLAMRIGGLDRIDLIDRRHWSGFAHDVGCDEAWVHEELLGLASRIPDAVTTICDAPDLVDVTALFRGDLVDRAAGWCEATRRRYG